ncbi:MAG: exo-alpha-sialidase, partial [Victivallales bacterium]|nr:exo-alpha-sialidase [Victivallales bacterium]
MLKIAIFLAALALFNSCILSPNPEKDNMPKITLQQIKTDFKGRFCYTHARGAVTPEGFAIITTQPLRLTGSDVFYGMEMTTSNDGGKSWTPLRKSKTLLRQDLGNGYSRALCDGTPMYHKKSGKLLLLGHDATYLNDDLAPAPQPRHTLWSVFNQEKNDWEPFREITMPDENAYYCCGNGSGQSVELENGDILIPVYYMSREEAKNPWGNCYHAMIMRCSFDGKEL